VKANQYFFFVTLFILYHTAVAQSLPVGSFGAEDYYRREQLSGRADSTVSFTIRPLFLGSLSKEKDIEFSGNTSRKFYFFNITGSDSAALKEYWQILPFTWQNQYNSHHPYGWNDGALIPSKGYQTMLSGGFYLEYGPLSIQLKPELVIAENKSFEEFPEDHYGIIWTWYYNYYNNIDLPVRFGNKSYSKLNPGQTSVRLNYKSLSFGVSTENLWWGPGIRNSLLMSNSAPGFLHLTLNTRKPVHTSVGSIEGQFIAGKLDASGYTPPDNSYVYLGSTLYQPKNNDWRYMSGIVFTYQPKWTPGLFLGFARSSQIYSKDLKSAGDYLPFFKSFSSYTANEKTSAPDRYTSLFMRWLWKEVQAEIYMEYGHNDQSRSFSDFIKNPEYGRAYIFGLRKLIPLAKRIDENILVSLEVTQLSQLSADIVRNAGGWYVDQNIRHGYTNKGEMIGAGIGPGGNLQSLDISWVKGVKIVGIQLERYIHNNDFYYYAYENSSDWRRHWTDLSIAAKGEWDIKNIIFNAKFNFIRSLNYGWYLLQTDPVNYFTNGRDVSNIQVQLGLTYRFD